MVRKSGMLFAASTRKAMSSWSRWAIRADFDTGERGRPEEAPYHTPVFVLTNEKRDPWVRPGGTAFFFVNNGPERALELAREAAGDCDIHISGGADVIQQYLRLGVTE